MAQKLGLIRNGYFNIAINHYTLATQARRDARVYGAVYKIFFFVGYFLHIVHAFVYVNVAGATAANAAAIMLQVNAVFQTNIQNRFSFGNRQHNGLHSSFFKVNLDVINFHCTQK